MIEFLFLSRNIGRQGTNQESKQHITPSLLSLSALEYTLTQKIPVSSY